jgi:hypothetical protein
MKTVSGVHYVHKNSVKDLPVWAYERYLNAVKWIGDWDYTIVAVNKQNVAFVVCEDFDSKFEPTVGDRLNVTDDTVTRLNASKTSPQIYHRRHLFVNESIPQGFDIKADKARVASWLKFKPDIYRMGRRLWWEEFLKNNALPRNF